MIDKVLLANLLDQLQGNLDELKALLVPKTQEAIGQTVVRSLDDVRRALEYPANVIPPTPTDEPDSIIGGEPTRDFPDCCAVGDFDSYFCSGTLIAPNLVVTARHCCEPTRVFLKGHDTSRPLQGEVIGVLRNIHHPTADIQVLVLERNSTVPPRHIARADEVEGATECTLVGFGTIDLDGVQGYGLKRKVKLGITSLDCSTTSEQSRFGCNPEIEMVAGHRGLLRDSCRGDSGGPLYIEGDKGFCLLGATSRGAKDANHTCGDGGIYIRVDKFVDWMQQETGVEIKY